MTPWSVGVTAASAAALHARLTLHITRAPLPTTRQFSRSRRRIATSTALPLGSGTRATALASRTSPTRALIGRNTLLRFLETSHINLEHATELLITSAQYFMRFIW